MALLEADHAAALTARDALAQDMEAAHASALGELGTANDALRASIGMLEAEAQQVSTARSVALIEEEIETCREIAEKCVFIMGFARSNTTITLGMLNCADNALLLGEADFFLDHHGENFTKWYNDQHKDFENQITKSSYAPDFVPEKSHKWWQWLKEASKFYDCIGEKIALSHYHLGESRPDIFRAFHEARFISSRYIFTLRNPIDVLLSSAKLMNLTTDQDMTRLMLAWLDFMQLWADSIRIFPRTMTLVAERLGEGMVADLEAFTGLDLGDASLLINPGNRRQHKLSKNFPTLVRFRSDLEELYAIAIAAIDESSALWQAEQKRNSAANDTPGNKNGTVAMTSRPLGRVWLRVQELRESLSQI